MYQTKNCARFQLEGKYTSNGVLPNRLLSKLLSMEFYFLFSREWLGRLMYLIKIDRLPVQNIGGLSKFSVSTWLQDLRSLSGGARNKNATINIGLLMLLSR